MIRRATNPRHSEHFKLTLEELTAVAKKLKIPVKHVVEYHRFMHGHPTTKLTPDTLKYIRTKLSVPNFNKLDNLVGLKLKG